jgi:hypothetical protein
MLLVKQQLVSHGHDLGVLRHVSAIALALERRTKATEEPSDDPPSGQRLKCKPCPIST